MKPNYLTYMLGRDQHYRNAFLLAVLLPVGCTAAAAVIGQNSAFFAHLLPPCALAFHTGLHCISCGATRATLALIRGDWLTAVYYNPYYIGFLVWLGYLYTRLVISLMVRPYRKYSMKATWPWGIAALVSAIAFLIIRNTPFYQSVFY